MTTRPDTVRAEIRLHLLVTDSPSLPVLAEIGFDPRDPYAVTMAFHTGVTEVVEWTFARSLLTDGVTRPVGDGDVQVWPAREGAATVVCLALSSPSGRARFEAPLGELIEFLTRTYSLVPTGHEGEFVDIEAELALLLGAGPQS